MTSLPLNYSDAERQRLNAQAQTLLDAHPRAVDFIARGAELAPGGEALVYIRSVDDPAPPTLSYESLLGLIAAAMRWLKAAGVGAEDGVALLAPACPAMAVAMWAATAVGVAMPLNLLFTREAVAAQLAAGQASIVNVTSIVGSRVHPFAGVAYAASKAGLAALTREIAAELAPRNVRCNAIAPGEIKTAILSPGTDDLVARNVPMKRLGEPREVAETIYFLCSEASSYITGAEIHISGGQHA